MAPEHLSRPAPTRWWDDRPEEDVFMRITDHERIGGPLTAPLTSRAGRQTGSYSLVPRVQPGNLVVDYDRQTAALVGVSIVLDAPAAAPILWGARGKSARKAGVRPTWQAGLTVPLGDQRPIDPPVTLDDVRSRTSEVMAVHDGLLELLPHRTSLYFPWSLGNGRLNTQQSYLVKLPREVARLFPSLEKALEAARRSFDEAPIRLVPELDRAAEEFARTAGDTRPPRQRSLRQGYSTDPLARAAVEAHAMNAAIAHYSSGWDVEDVHLAESYDLVCRREGVELHVEVKGTTGTGQTVLLTRNEVRHAQSYANVALFVLAEIELRSSGDAVEGTGGIATVFEPWLIDSGTLVPVGFEYEVPSGGSDGADA